MRQVWPPELDGKHGMEIRSDAYEYWTVNRLATLILMHYKGMMQSCSSMQQANKSLPSLEHISTPHEIQEILTKSHIWDSTLPGDNWCSRSEGQLNPQGYDKIMIPAVLEQVFRSSEAGNRVFANDDPICCGYFGITQPSPDFELYRFVLLTRKQMDHILNCRA